MVSETLRVLLEPVGVEVRSEVQVVSAPPKADLILIQRRKENWTEEQRLLLADGLRDLGADQILVELKITESLNEDALSQLSVYDHLYLGTEKLRRDQLRSVLISSKTPDPKFLKQFAFDSVGPVGVYESRPAWGGVLRLILLNELADEPQNAPLKCFASRQEERKKGFETIKNAGLFQVSVAFGRIIVGLWRLQMKGSLNHPEMEGITPEYVTQLGKEWLDFIVDATPDEELFTLPKFEHRLEQKHLKGRQEGEATLLLRLLQKRFGSLPKSVTEWVHSANQSTLEIWGDRMLDAKSLEDVFSDMMSMR